MVKRYWNRRFLMFFALVMMLCGNVFPQERVRCSMLTCAPGDEVYSLYGHTALRITILEEGLDAVFNYGVFDFNTPNFGLRFTLGQCDYMVMMSPFSYFCEPYAERGSEVVEQVLNLSDEEGARLLRMMIENVRPENRTYRYNFLYNNCTTKVRDQLEKVVDGYIVYHEDDSYMTYRQIMHEFTGDSPWAELGNDILLGANVDTVLSQRAAQFIPSRLMKSFDTARIYDMDGNSRPLVCSTNVLVPARPVPSEAGFPLSPLQVGWIFVGLCLLVMACEWHWQRMMWGFDIVLMLFQGLVGALLWFVFLFSEHPTLDSNWQVWVLNPLPLFCIVWVVRKALKKEICIYHYVNFAILTLFIIFSTWIPQDFSDIVVPLAFGLLTRPLSYYLNYRTKADVETLNK